MNNFIGDSGDYEYLSEAVELAKDIDGICLEIGLRLGKGTATIIDAVSKHCPHKKMVSVDPFGSILYEGREGQICRLDYTNEMRNTCLKDMYPYSEQMGVKFHFIELTDDDFFDKYADGVIFYDLERIVLNKYSTVHLDGPHTVKDVKKELDFFIPRMGIGATIVFDDVTPDFYDHIQIEEYIKEKFKIVRTGNKKQIVQKIC